ncbi:hypothetical protein Bbelb_197860 [Branchiostoma belcheri]|nr:hypothetical protein Bbelb_197860 [Branchiostoma belcheri]
MTINTFGHREFNNSIRVPGIPTADHGQFWKELCPEGRTQDSRQTWVFLVEPKWQQLTPGQEHHRTPAVLNIPQVLLTTTARCTCIACPVQPFCNLRWQQVAAGDTWHLAKNITGPSANDNGRQREQTKPREERGRCGTLPSFVVVLGCVVGGRGQEEPRRVGQRGGDANRTV